MVFHKDLAGDDLHTPLRWVQDTDPGGSARALDLWHAPATGLLKVRKGDNSAWLTVVDPQSHAPVTITDSSSIDLSLSGQALSAAAIFGTAAGTVAEGDHTHAAPSVALDDLTDVTITTPTSGQVLSYDGTEWVNQAAATGGATDLADLADVTLTSPAAGHLLRYDGTAWVNVPDVVTLNFVIDGGGAAITTGSKGMIVVDFAATMTAATLLADQSGSIVIDVWKTNYAGAPPLVANSICASALPTLSSAQKAQDTTLTGWTTSIAAGDVLRVNVDSASVVQRVTLALTLRRTA